ncbi:MAG: hypothetical protein ACRD2M_01475 [Terriglobales bacterium]
MTRKTVIPFVEFQPAIAKGQTANATVTLYPSPGPGGMPVTLNLGTTSGTGSAIFTSTNSSTMTVTESGSVAVKGTDASSVADNVQIKASVSGRESGDSFSVVWVTLALRSATGLTVTSDNERRLNYEGVWGHTNLGAFDSLADFGCKTGTETVGTVQPSNYTGLVVLRRTKLNYGVWDGSVLLATTGPNPVTTPSDDTSNDAFRDDDPQSGGSAGKVYDLDTPGAQNVELDHTYRVRQNFSTYAVLDSATNTVAASDSLAWYSAVSCTLTENGPILNFDVANDNQANVGTVPLSWNVQ